MNNLKIGNYFILKHPDLAYNNKRENDCLYKEYVRIYNDLKNKKYKIEYIEKDGVLTVIKITTYKFFFNEIKIIKPKFINKIKIL